MFIIMFANQLVFLWCIMPHPSHIVTLVKIQGSESELLGLCILLAASASHSEHPLSRGCEEGAAQVAGCTAAMLLQGAPEVSDFEVLLGVGVKFRLGDLKVSGDKNLWMS